MPLPALPLPVNIVVGYTPHAPLHNDVNSVANYLVSDDQLANLFLASPSAAPGKGGFRAITSADIAAVLASPPSIGGTAQAAVSSTLLVVNGAAATSRDLFYRTASVSRWLFRANGTAESGANAGTDFQVSAFDDAGVSLGVVMGMKRSNLRVILGGNAQNALAKLHVIGTADEIQHIDQGFSTQTGNIYEARKSDNTVNFGVSNLGKITVPTTITAPGTTGNQTINKIGGRVNIAAGGTTITVTNSLVTANSIIVATCATNDATAIVKNVVAAAGSFVINIVATTAEVALNFIVLA